MNSLMAFRDEPPRVWIVAMAWAIISSYLGCEAAFVLDLEAVRFFFAGDLDLDALISKA